MPNYWVVGATFSNSDGGRDDMAPEFIRRGYWYLGWSNKKAPDQAALRDQIQPEDRIAIKKLMGRGSRNIRITTLGIVTEVDGDGDDRCIYVRWVLAELDRVVPIVSPGLIQSIDGPFEQSDSWTREVFQI